MSPAEYSMVLPPGQKPSPRPFSDFHSLKYNIVSLVAYLIGVEKRHFENEHEPPKLDVYERLKKDKNARIVRNLCMIRTGLERNYKSVQRAFRFDLKNLSSLPQYIPPNSLMQLAEDGIQLQKGRPDVEAYLLAINKELSNRTGNCKNLFPEWLNWDYIRPIFVVPAWLKPEGLKEAWAEYVENSKRYPYQCFINWPGANDGNILYSDDKFVRLLYERNEDKFTDWSLVTDAGDIAMDNIASFIDRSHRAIVVVDCENSDPIKLSAVLSSLPKSGLTKIEKVLLFDSDYTTSGWQIISQNVEQQKPANWGVLSSVAAFPIQRITVPRLKQNKSQVDMTLAANTCREVYQNDVDSVILVSSDSDYWALIQTLEDTNFLVMVEKEKCGKDIKEALLGRGIHYCYMDDFYTGASYAIKTIALQTYIQNIFDGVIQFNLESLLDEAIRSTWVQMSSKERKAFYDRYLRKIHPDISPSGNLRLVLGQ